MKSMAFELRTRPNLVVTTVAYCTLDASDLHKDATLNPYGSFKLGNVPENLGSSQADFTDGDRKCNQAIFVKEVEGIPDMKSTKFKELELLKCEQFVRFLDAAVQWVAATVSE